jgi:predicted nucleic acid-binding protein
VAGRYGLKADEVEAFVGRLREEGVSFDDPVDPPRVVPDDPNDDYLIALALSSGAEFFVTRDRHFDNLRVQGVKIRTPGRLLRELAAD